MKISWYLSIYLEHEKKTKENVGFQKGETLKDKNCNDYVQILGYAMLIVHKLLCFMNWKYYFSHTSYIFIRWFQLLMGNSKSLFNSLSGSVLQVGRQTWLVPSPRMGLVWHISFAIWHSQIWNLLVSIFLFKWNYINFYYKSKSNNSHKASTRITEQPYSTDFCNQ